MHEKRLFSFLTRLSIIINVKHPIKHVSKYEIDYFNNIELMDDIILNLKKRKNNYSYNQILELTQIIDYYKSDFNNYIFYNKSYIELNSLLEKITLHKENLKEDIYDNFYHDKEIIDSLIDFLVKFKILYSTNYIRNRSYLSYIPTISLFKNKKSNMYTGIIILIFFVLYGLNYLISFKLIYIITISLLFFFFWLYFSQYKEKVNSISKNITVLLTSLSFTIVGSFVFNLIELNINLDKLDITFYKNISNIIEEKKVSTYKFLPKKDITIYFEKGSFIKKDYKLNKLENILKKENKYIIKITGFSSKLRVLNKISVNDNYQLSLARANTLKEEIFKIIDKNKIFRENIIIDIFAKSSEHTNIITSTDNLLNQKVVIEIIELIKIKN